MPEPLVNTATDKRGAYDSVEASYMDGESSKRLISKFDTIGAMGTTAATIICGGLLVFMAYVWVFNLEGIGMFQRLMITLFPLFVFPLLLRIELPEIKRLEMDEEGITLINPFIGTKRKFAWTELDGYKTMIHVTRGGLVNELIIVSGETELFDISQYYYRNFSEIRNRIALHLNGLGEVNLGYWEYVKQRFLK